MKNIGEWSLDSWKNFKISQQPEYIDQEALEDVQNKVKHLIIKDKRIPIYNQLQRSSSIESKARKGTY